MKQRHYYLKEKTGQMSKKITLSGEEVAAVMKHAAERGMTFEEYIQEFIGILHEEQAKGNVELDIKSVQDKIQTNS